MGKKIKLLLFLILEIVSLVLIVKSTEPKWRGYQNIAKGYYPTIGEYLKECGEGDLPEEYVRVSLDKNLGCVAEREIVKEHKNVQYIYFAMLEDGSLMPVVVDAQWGYKMDAMAENTLSFLQGETTGEALAEKAIPMLCKISDPDPEQSKFIRYFIEENKLNETGYFIRSQIITEDKPESISSVIEKECGLKIAIALVLLLLIIITFVLLIKSIIELNKDKKAKELAPADHADNIETVVHEQVFSNNIVSRMTLPLFVNRYKQYRNAIITAAIFAVIGVLIYVVPNYLYDNNKQISEKESVEEYDMDIPSEYAKAELNSPGILTLEESPTPNVSVDETSSSAGIYIAYGRSSAHILIMDNSDFEMIMPTIHIMGKAELHGYYDVVSDETKERIIDHLNLMNFMSQKSYSVDDYDDLFGKYALVVQEKDNENEEKMISGYDIMLLSKLGLFVAVVAVFVMLRKISLLNKFKDMMRTISDAEFAGIENSISSENVKTFTNEIYCTDKYIIALGKYYKIIKYADITWAYLYTYIYNGSERRNHLQVFVNNKLVPIPQFGPGEENKQRIYSILRIIHEKNPGAKIGYDKNKT